MSVLEVLVADDEPQVRSALRFLLEQEAAIRVVGEADTRTEVMRQLQRLNPHLLILDWELPGLLAGDIQEVIAGLTVIALSSNPKARKNALEAGVYAFASKVDPPDALLAALRSLTASDMATSC